MNFHQANKGNLWQLMLSFSLCLCCGTSFSTSAIAANNGQDKSNQEKKIFSKNHTPESNTLKLSAGTKASKAIPAKKIDNAPKIDGKLDDAVWQNAAIVSEFTTFEPNVGNPASQKTEVKIAYDNEAIYIGAYMHDTAPDSILQQLGLRDSWNLNADMFAIFLDTYDDDINSFGFFVTASGVQNDLRESANGEDGSWDAVWASKVQIVDDGWIAEFAIPYSALRFPKQEVQNWGVGFMRNLRRLRERSTWQNFDPAEAGFVNQFGTLEGLTGITPPLRLSFSPYISTYYQTYRDKDYPEDNNNTKAIRGGMDIKYGINESFTLDMTLIPDFGQVQSDDEILNLGPFEVRYNERRPFFMEGTELFNKGNLFYSRRVGSRPSYYWDVEDSLEDGEEIVSNPAETQMFNATKISGRTKDNLGIGFFNAVTGEMNAEIKNAEGETRIMQTEPLANYNILVFDQALKNRSYVSLINTNVMRAGKGRDANVTGTEFRLNNKKNTYALEGGLNVSQIWEEDLNDKGYESGYALGLNWGKTSGNFRYFLFTNIENDTYNPNDLGFLYNNNEWTSGVRLRYSTFNPIGIFNELFGGINLNYSRLYKPSEYQNVGVVGWFGTTFTNFLNLGFNYSYRPTIGYDFFEPREDGRFHRVSRGGHIGGWMSSDYRKKVALDVNWSYESEGLYNVRGFDLWIGPRIRFSDRLLVIYGIGKVSNPNEIGYASIVEHDEDDVDNEVIYGRRNRSSYNNTLEFQYLFSSKMAINFRARHYWSRVTYDKFHLLEDDGYLGTTTFNDDLDVSYNAFTLNLGYTWQFAPGSEMSIVWKNDIYHSLDSDSDNYANLTSENYFDNFSRTMQSPQTNNFSLKVLYFLDYQRLRNVF